jgi:hypothetical protein
VASHYKIAFVVALAVFMHVPFLHLPPNGYHLWREVDTATVAENFFRGDFDPRYPEVNAYGKDKITTLGTELPLYTFGVATLYKVFGFSHIWPRVFSLLFYVLFIVSLGFYTSNPKKRWVLVFLAAFSPLSFFYGIKIQPDMLALCAMSYCFVFYRQWLNAVQSSGKILWALGVVVLITIAGAIKPHYLCVGLPMLFLTPWRQYFPAFVIATAGLFPIALWFHHAKKLNEMYAKPYFYLGGNVWENLSFVLTANFWQNTILTWPFELVSIPPLVFAGLFFLRSEGWIMPWIAGCFVVFFLAAGHCATPHDYYYLPMVVPLVVAIFHVLERWPKWIPLVCLAMVIYTPLRLKNRVVFENDFAQARSLGIKEAIVLDKMPGRLLYWLGAKGYQYSDPADAHEFPIYLDKKYAKDGDEQVTPSIWRRYTNVQ